MHSESDPADAADNQGAADEAPTEVPEGPMERDARSQYALEQQAETFHALHQEFVSAVRMQLLTVIAIGVLVVILQAGGVVNVAGAAAIQTLGNVIGAILLVGAVIFILVELAIIAQLRILTRLELPEPGAEDTEAVQALNAENIAAIETDIKSLHFLFGVALLCVLGWLVTTVG
jgi:hypothetical protein